LPNKAVKKGKPKSKPQKVKPLDDALAEYKKVIDARLRIATSTYEAQDDLTKEVIDRIRDRLRIAATGVVMINGRPFKLDPQWIDFNLLFLACEILNDLYINGLKVANFKPSALYCAECRKEIVGVREPKKKRHGR
jgi:hypothetical protein